MITDITKLLPENLIEYPFYTKVVDILENIVATRQDEYKDIFYKFRDVRELNGTALENLIGEFGYDYVTDVLDLTTAKTQSLTGFLYLIHILKGHKEGVELVLKLLGIDEYSLEEWWEKIPVGTADTFDFIAYLDLVDFTYTEIIAIDERLQIFFRNYVYPLADIWDIRAQIKVEGNVPTVGAACCFGVFVTIYHELELIRWDASGSILDGGESTLDDGESTLDNPYVWDNPELIWR